MKVTEIHPFAVMDDFPSHREIIKHLFKTNKTFHILCFDYQQCAKALRYWSNSDLPKASQRRGEYEELLSELKSEILLTLNNLNQSNPNEAIKG